MQTPHESKQNNERFSNVHFDVNLLGCEGIVEKRGSDCPVLYVEGLQDGRSTMPIHLSPEEYGLLVKSSGFGSFALDDAEQGAMMSLGYTLKLAKESSPNVIDTRHDDQYGNEDNNLGYLYTIPCLGSYLQHLRIRTFKFSNNSSEIQDASTDMVASNIRFAKSILHRFLRRQPDMYKHYYESPYDDLLAAGISVIPRGMKLYDLTRGIDFNKYIGHSIWREIERAYNLGRGLGVLRENRSINEIRESSPKLIESIESLLYPSRLYDKEGEPFRIPDESMDVDELVNLILIPWALNKVVGTQKLNESMSVLNLYYLQGNTLEEIAKKRGTSRQAVQEYLKKAEKRLKEAILKKYGYNTTIRSFI